MEPSVLTDVVLPVSLAIIMLGMGLSLTLDDFRRVVRFPKAAAIGLVNQLILLPLIGYGVAIAFGLEPLLAVGLMLLAACPGGTTSNLISHVARGDLALSVTLTAISSTITIFTIPMVVNWALQHFAGEGQVIRVPFVQTMAAVFGITALPVGIGMFIRSRNAIFADRLEQPFRTASTVLFVVILLGIIASNLDLLREHFPRLGPATFALNIITMLIGWGTAQLFGLNLAQRIAVSIESGVQNGTLAIVVATTILSVPETSLPGAIYGLVMFVSGGFMMWWFGRRGVAKPGAA
ncbi:MAG: bile acid:sodium symporter family protein [Bacteroidota bacterium]